MIYMVLIGGAFNATVSFRVQLLNALAASLIALLWLGTRFWQRRSVSMTGLEIALILFVGVQWFTAFTSLQPRLSLEQAATTTAWALAFIILVDLLANNWPKNFIENALVLIAAVITVQALIETGVWLLGWLKLGIAPLIAFRVTGFLGHPNLTAAALNLLLPLVAVLLMRTANRPYGVALGLLIIGMLVVEFFTSSRSGWISLAILTATFVGLLSLKKSGQTYIQAGLTRWRTLPGWVQLTILAIAGIFLVGLAYLFWRQTIQISHPEFFTSRQYIWGPAWENFLARPLVGVGPGLYTWLYSKYASIPPEWLAPHAHSILFQALNDSGLPGLLAGLALLGSAAYLLWQRWHTHPDYWETAAFISIAVGWFIHHLTDYLFGTPAFTFLFVVIAALALVPQNVTPPVRQYRPLYLVLPLAGIITFAAYMLYAAGLNDQALTLAATNKWPEAAARFEQAAQADPGLTVYWQNAANAETRAGNLTAAESLWQRVAHDDPYWAIPAATLGLLQPSLSQLQTANTLAPHSDLLALNAGVLAEKLGDTSTAQTSYQQALALKPALASGLFWQQTPLRQKALAQWKLTAAPTPTSLDQGQQALADNQAAQAIQYFTTAQTEFPLINAPYIGLARAYWLAKDEQQAQHYFNIAQLIPATTPSETLPLYIFQGDWADAHGDQAGAMKAYKIAFSIVNEYTSDGPGTYGYPQRSWLIYHRPALPSDLIPQFAHADITPQLDQRFAKLANWLAQAGETDTACFVLNRVYREAPLSESGKLLNQLCTQ